MHNFQERQFSLSFTQLAACVLALIGGALIVLNFVASPTNDHYGFASIPPFVVAMLLAIRGYFCRMAGLVKETQALIQDAYDVGREVGREEATVRSLR